MSILRYEPSPYRRQKVVSADEALLALLLTAGAGILFLTGWFLLPPLLGLANDMKAWALTGAGFTLTSSTAAVGWWVLRPLWPRRYEGSAGVWGVMLLSLGFLLALAVACFCILLVVSLAKQE